MATKAKRMRGEALYLVHCICGNYRIVPKSILLSPRERDAALNGCPPTDGHHGCGHDLSQPHFVVENDGEVAALMWDCGHILFRRREEENVAKDEFLSGVGAPLPPAERDALYLRHTIARQKVLADMDIVCHSSEIVASSDSQRKRR